MSKYRDKLLSEIESTVAAKLFNIQHGTATKRETQIVKECSGFISLLNHSVLTPKEVYGLWKRSGLVYQ
jgi:hypothetical protein